MCLEILRAMKDERQLEEVRPEIQLRAKWRHRHRACRIRHSSNGTGLEGLEQQPVTDSPLSTAEKSYVSER